MKKIALLFTTLCLLQSAHGQTITSAVPGYISYQGRALDSTGAVIGSAAPVNRTVTFRVWDHASNVLLANLLYSEQQTVTISGGEFSVLIGQGVVTAGTALGFAETTKGLPTVKIGDLAVFGGSTRYLGVTIDDGTVAVDNEITPRQQIVSSAYAFRAKYAEQLGSNGTAALTALDSGNVGIGNTTPPALFTVSGANTSTTTSTPQLLVTADDITERLRIGIDSTGNGTGFIQAYKESVGAQNLLLNPSGGNVGIGTTAPAFPLSFAATTGDKISLFPGTAPSSYGFGVAANALQIHGNGVTDNIVFGYGSSASMTETMRIQGNGNVGIGTASPANKLTVAGGNVYVSGTNSGVQVANAGATKMVEMSIADSAGSFSTSAVAGDAVIRASGAAKLHLQTGSGASAISIDTSNNVTLSNSVGIGTSTPTNRFSLDAPVSARSTSTTVTTATAIAHIGASDSLTYFGSYDSSAGWGNWIQSMRTWDNYAFPLMLNPNGGNVGIGTAAPAYKLDVNGTAHIASNVYLNNNSTLYGTNTGGVSQPVFWPRADDNGTYLNHGTGGLFIRDNASNVGVYIIGDKMAVGGITDTSQGSITADNGFVAIGTGSNGLTSYAKMSFRTDRAGLAFDVYNTGQYPNAWRGFSYDGDSNIDWYSDRNLKKDIVDAEPMLDRLMQLPFRRFHWKDVSDPAVKPEFGVIAQEVELLFPDLVATGKDGMKTVGYTSFATIACKALQEYKTRNDADLGKLNAQIHEKDVRIAALEAKLAAQEKRTTAQADDDADKEQRMEARLIALEQHLNKGSAPETVSMKTANVAK